MTSKQLNRAVLTLYNQIESNREKLSIDEYYEWLENTFKIEFKRLYRADDAAEYLTVKSLRMMIAMNHAYRVIPFHQFYLGAKA
jgi:hypothetical protein